MKPWLPCLLEDDHDGYHYSICDAPCTVCGGVDEHYEDCPGEDEFFNAVLQINFDDEGAYWCVGWFEG